jgi:hypothetical protein
MIIIDKTIPPSPLYVRHEKPDFSKYKHPQLSKEKYWETERQRWLEGYSDITGIHYLYIQELKLLTITGELIRPKWRETDSLFFDGWDKTCRDKWDMMLVKRTELGFSSMAGAAIPLHVMLTNPGSKCILTSADDERRRVLFDDKLIIAFDNLDDDIRPNKARTRAKGQQDLFLANEDRSSRTFSGLRSRTIGIDTVKNPTAFEAHRAMYILIDELFLHPKARTAKSAAARRMVQGSKKIASMLFGGTVGDITTAGGEEALAIYKSAEATRVNVLYLGGTHAMDEFMTNGWNDLKAGEDWRQQQLERLAKAQDKTEYFKFLTDYPDPTNIEAVFNLVKDCALPHHLQITLNDAKDNIKKENIQAGKYSITQNGTKIQALPDLLKGKINIVRPPIMGHRYIAGTDPIPFGNNLLGEGSDYSMIILDLDTMEFVADYTERNLDDMEVVANSILLQKLYYRAPTMLELNRGEVVLKDYLALGEQNLLAPMPTHLGIVWSERKYPYGFQMTGGPGNQVNARCETLTMKFLLAHGYKQRHKRFIDECFKLSTGANTDVLSAAQGALLYAAELEEIKKIQNPTPTQHRIRHLVRDKNGRMVPKIDIVELIR